MKQYVGNMHTVARWCRYVLFFFTVRERGGDKIDRVNQAVLFLLLPSSSVYLIDEDTAYMQLSNNSPSRPHRKKNE